MFLCSGNICVLQIKKSWSGLGLAQNYDHNDVTISSVRRVYFSGLVSTWRMWKGKCDFFYGLLCASAVAFQFVMVVVIMSCYRNTRPNIIRNGHVIKVQSVCEYLPKWRHVIVERNWCFYLSCMGQYEYKPVSQVIDQVPFYEVKITNERSMQILEICLLI